MVKALDAILGVACVSLFAKYDDPMRLKLYGLPGEYRLPAHGLEYRSLSNAWLSHPFITNLVFDLARKALVFGEKGYRKYWNASDEEVIRCMVDCDVELAHEIMERNKRLFCGIIKASYNWASDATIEMLYNVFYNGMESAINDPSDFVKNWKLSPSSWIRHTGARTEPNVICYTDNMYNNNRFKF